MFNVGRAETYMRDSIQQTTEAMTLDKTVPYPKYNKSNMVSW